MLKEIETHKIGKTLKSKDISKMFPGANNGDMRSYLLHTKKQENDLIILHYGRNLPREEKTEEEIMTEIISTAVEMKTENDVMTSIILPRKDK